MGPIFSAAGLCLFSRNNVFDSGERSALLSSLHRPNRNSLKPVPTYRRRKLCRMFSTVLKVRRRPERLSSSTFSLPSLKRRRHLTTCVLDKVHCWPP
ncbi:hypothetical protein TNCV_4218301 [Trichonephila clavipes]|nr:hypothetical protein TNCV_4218301 [Trichonephila clavipes]